MLKRLLAKIKQSLDAGFSLGAGFNNKLKLAALFFWLPLAKRLGKANDHFYKIRITKFGRTAELLLQTSSDLAILYEIFKQNEYALNLPQEPEVILDLGSNIGLAAVYFKLKYPHAKVYAFEPAPDTYKVLERNIRGLEGVKAYNTMISDTDGQHDFYISPQATMSASAMLRFEGQQSVKVEAKKLDTVVSELNLARIDLLKFDIEGSELDVFRSFTGLAKVRTLIGELHLDLIKGGENEFVDIFAGFDVKLKRLSSRRLIVEAQNYV